MGVALTSMAEVIGHRCITEPEELIFGSYGERCCKITCFCNFSGMLVY